MWKHMLGYVPVNLANIIISFGTIAILTRLLDEAEFGRYALAVASLHFTHMVLFSWIEAAMARYYARAERNGKIADHMRTSFEVAVVMGAVCLPLIIAALYYSPMDPTMKMLIGFALSSTCFTLIFNIAMEAHKAAHRIGRYSAIYSTQSILGFSVGILLILLTDLREVAPFVGIVVANLFALAVDLPFLLSRMKGGKLRPDHVKRAFSYGMPISLSLMLAYILSQGDLFFIKYFMGDAAVGHYNAGYNLSNRSLDVLFIWIGMALTPLAVTALEQDGMEKTKRVMKLYGETLLLITLPAAAGIALVAEPAGIIIGESVREKAVEIMPWIAFSGVLNGFIAYYVQRAFMLSGRTGVLAICMIPPVLLNIVLNILLIPKFGLFGAVAATIAAYAMGLVITTLVARKYFPLPLPIKALFQTVFACLVMAGVVLTLPDTVDQLPDVLELLVKAIVGATVYGIVVFGLNVASCRELVKDLLVKLKARSRTPVEV